MAGTTPKEEHQGKRERNSCLERRERSAKRKKYGDMGGLMEAVVPERGATMLAKRNVERRAYSTASKKGAARPESCVSETARLQ